MAITPGRSSTGVETLGASFETAFDADTHGPARLIYVEVPSSSGEGVQWRSKGPSNTPHGTTLATGFINIGGTLPIIDPTTLELKAATSAAEVIWNTIQGSK